MFSVQVTSLSNGAAQTVTVTPVANGEYQVQYTLTQAGEYKMTVRMQANGVGSMYPIASSPMTIKCIVSTTDPLNTVLSGLGVTNAVAGTPTDFLATLFDSGANQRTSGGDTLSVSLTSLSHTITSLEVFDN